MRTLLTPRWLGLLLAALVLATVMVFLGKWQLARYHERSEFNDRVSASESGPAVPIADVLPGPGTKTPESLYYRRVTAAGTFDAAHEVLVRNRTADGQAGFEVVTPLVLSDGSAVLVDRGWIPPNEAGPTVAPDVPAAPSGVVTVVGRVHPSDSGAVDRVVVGGRTEIKRINTASLGQSAGYAVRDAYLLAADGTPGATSTTIAIPTQNAWQNAAYVVQWWLFAGLTLCGFVYLLVKEIQEPTPRSGPAERQPREAAQVF